MLFVRSLSQSTRAAMVLAAATAFALGIGATFAVGPLPREATPARANASPPRDDGARIEAAGTIGYPAEVLRVLDGDTFEARVRLWPGLDVTTRVRLRGIDAPELRARCAEGRRKAEAARDALAALLAQGAVSITRVTLDKYGGRVVASGSSRRTPDLSEALLDAGLARRYGGGRRGDWC
jgi:endonuclease YncB( thermonuclease family)